MQVMQINDPASTERLNAAKSHSKYSAARGNSKELISYVGLMSRIAMIGGCGLILLPKVARCSGRINDIIEQR